MLSTSAGKETNEPSGHESTTYTKFETRAERPTNTGSRQGPPASRGLLGSARVTSGPPATARPFHEVPVPAIIGLGSGKKPPSLIMPVGTVDVALYGIKARPGVSSMNDFDTWISIMRDPPITERIARLHRGGFAEESMDWAKRNLHLPGVRLSLSVLAATRKVPSLSSHFMLIYEPCDTWLSISAFQKIPARQIDPLGEQVATLRSVEAALKQAGHLLDISEMPPLVSLLPDEAAWLRAHGEPKLAVGNLTFEIVDKRRPWLPEPESRLPEVSVDVWDIFRGDGGAASQLRSFMRRASPGQRIAAAASVRTKIDEWLALRGCRTDGEAMLAAAVLGAGESTWDYLLAHPEEAYEAVSASDGDEILDIVDWGL